jgi:hypothetical protein
MEMNEVRRLNLLQSSYIRHYGPDDPRTVTAARALIQAKIAEHEDAIAELRRSLAGLPGRRTAA